MPKPITMTPEMIQECFDEVAVEFEKKFREAKEKAVKGEKLPDAKFSFSLNIPYQWENDDRTATVEFSPTAFSKMMLMMNGTDKEIGWHGEIVRSPDDPYHYIVEDVFLFPQQVSGADVNPDQVKYASWAMDEVPTERFNKMRFHGHSHVNMAVSPSGTDMKYREDMLGQFTDGFYVFIIINKKLEMSGQVYDFDNNVLFDTEDIVFEVTGDLAADVSEERKKYVSQATAYKYNYQTPYTTPGIPSTTTPVKTKSPYIYDDDYDYGPYGGGWNDDYWRNTK